MVYINSVLISKIKIFCNIQSLLSLVQKYSDKEIMFIKTFSESSFNHLILFMICGSPTYFGVKKALITF